MLHQKDLLLDLLLQTTRDLLNEQLVTQAGFTTKLAARLAVTQDLLDVQLAAQEALAAKLAVRLAVNY